MSTKHGNDSLKDGIRPIAYTVLNGGDPIDVEGAIVEEAQACISVNGREIATFMCSPNDLDQLVYGFLYNESIIEAVDDVAEYHISKSNCVDVWLTYDFTPPERRIITAGCGGGVTFDDLTATYPPLTSNRTVSAEQLAALMRSVHLGASRYQVARGIHTAALATADGIVLQTEDIGRHNALDKLRGAALLAGQTTDDMILLTSGRISSEMINKARRLETAIVCSRTSPTSTSVALADAWGITIVGYLRQNRMRIYTHPERITTENTPVQAEKQIVE